MQSPAAGRSTGSSRSAPADPITLRSDRCQASGNCFPDLVPGKDPNAAPEGGRRPEKWFDTSAVNAAPPPGSLGNLGLQTNYAPGQKNMDLSLFKNFKFTERCEPSSAPRHTTSPIRRSLDIPGNKVQNSDFGVITGTQAGTERKMQMALRILF